MNRALSPKPPHGGKSYQHMLLLRLPAETLPLKSTIYTSAVDIFFGIHPVALVHRVNDNCSSLARGAGSKRSHTNSPFFTSGKPKVQPVCHGP